MKTHLNLLPWSCRQNQMVRLRAVQWAAVCGVVSILTVTVFGLRMTRHQAAAAEVGWLQEQNAPLERVRGAIGDLRTRLANLRAQETTLARLETPRPALTLLGLVGRSVSQCDGLVRVEQLSLRSVEEDDKSGGIRAANTTTVTIKGLALDNLAASRFVVALRNSRSFDRVELKASIEEATSQRKACSYLVECGY
jgi:Tfp pilus assembly protein PilN